MWEDDWDSMLPRALNHMAVPALGWLGLLDLAAELGCVGVEFRNDLARPLFDGDAPEDVAAAAKARGLRILALAEVKAFNDWSDAKQKEAADVIAIAKACGAEAVSLIPRNDGARCGKVERIVDLRVAMENLAPMLGEEGLKGLIEPLGFDTCPLRRKAEVVMMIEALGQEQTFKIVHDTFHHALAGEDQIFAQHTGIVHISGVSDPQVAVPQMRDGHRGLVDAQDRLGNIAQLQDLQNAGYQGPISFEPFAASVHAITDPGEALAGSFQFISAALADLAA